MAPTPILPARYSPEGRYTWDDFVALPDDDRRELIDGHLIQVEQPTQLHEFIVVQIIWCLETWARATKSGTVLGSGYKIQIDYKRGVMPDVQFYRKGHLPKAAQEGLVGGAPDVAVEIISPSSATIDRVTKFNWYKQIGVPEYWLIDPDARAFMRYVLRDGQYFVDAHAGDEILKPETLPGLEISLAELWKGSDES